MESKASDSWSLQKRISELLQNECSSDIEFLIGSPPKRYFCHKVILAAGSPVFQTMFFGAIRQKSPVRVPDGTARGFSLMLQYLYSDSIGIEDEWDAFEVAYLAKKYLIESMFALCETFLVENLTFSADNIFTIYEEASFLGMKKLQDYCLRFISRNASETLFSESFLEISKDACLDILRLDFMNVESEVYIIEALWLWGRQRCKDKGLKCISENIRQHTKEFLKHVRFFALNLEELLNILEKCQILDTSDELAVLWNSAMPSTKRHVTMPPNICTETKTRSFWSSNKISFPGQYRYDGNMTAFLIEDNQTNIEITVTGSPVTVIGTVVAFKSIPCYSQSDRSLDIEVLAMTSSSQTQLKSNIKAEETGIKEEQKQMLLFDDYIVVEEEQILSLTVTTSGEGIRLMQPSEEIMIHDLGKSKVCLKMNCGREKNKMLLAIKELMIV